ncbi:hypothetical protein N5D52_07995 [Pseudomonas sp. GD03860]|uniref:hypothetical protein n=1 Tax=Pseudomonas TaxID=286 RepID=UPI0023646E09|nr:MULTISPECIES: hypothetical protein [Pseudomonas]MDD2058644.1 hypothetical protein [Pseudomonas putida]MDH0636877.1 hypothetical protein [Pseudomonas sp. GD03860]
MFELPPHWALWATCCLAAPAVATAQPQVAPPNPYLAQSYNNQTHWNDGASDSTALSVARGSYKMTPDAYRVVPNESGSLMQYTDKVNGTDVYWYWAGFSLRKLKIADDFKITEIARVDLPVKLPNYTPVTAEQRLEQAAQTRKFLDAKDEKGLLDYMQAQPNRMLTGTSDQLLGGAIYSLLTRDNAFIGASARRVFRIDQNDPGDPSSGMKLTQEVQLPDALFDNEKTKRSVRIPVDTAFGMGMTLNGYLVVNTMGGTVATLDRTTLKLIDSYRIEGTDEVFLNSFATGPEVDGGAVYVASNQNMYRLVVDKHGKIHADDASGAWKAPYERGLRFTSVKVGDGTGSTPTLMGYGPDEDKLVVFTDGSKKMNLVAMWRDKIPAGWKQKPGTLSPRVADQRAVDLGDAIPVVQSEQSVAVYDGHAFVVNNIPAQDKPALDKSGYYVTMLNGMTRPAAKGVAMLKWDSAKDQWNTLWTRTDVGSVSVVPMISGGSRMALINGVYTARQGEGYHIGMDLDTGKTVLEIATGSDPVFNGMYAPIKVDAQGRLMYGMAFGLVLMDTHRMQKIEQVAKRQ